MITKEKVADFAKFYPVSPGEWMTVPNGKPYYVKCCDCGLVHMLTVKIENGEVMYQVSRAQAMTTEERLARELEHAKDIIRVSEQLAELDEHVERHELQEFESCEICNENGKYAHLKRHYERLTRDYGLALARALLTLTEQRDGQQECPNCNGAGYFSVTRDMATDAGQPERVGSQETCGTCKGDGWVIESEPSTSLSSTEALKTGSTTL
jgi:hypothetical protein